MNEEQAKKRIEALKIKKIFIGISKDKELCELEFNKNFMNKEKYIYFTPHWYRGIVSETEGEENAREILSESDYWDEIGMLDKKSFLTDFIDFEKVADHVINNDGWEMTNGEYYFIADIDKEAYFIDLGGIGQEIKREELKEIFVSEEDLKFILGIKDHIDIKDKKNIDKLISIFNKYGDKQDHKEIAIKYKKVCENGD